MGALCVVDVAPRRLLPAQIEALERLARQCVTLMEARSANERLTQLMAQESAALDALSASEARLRSVSDSALDAIVAADDHGKIISWNVAAERIFGHTSAEAIGLPLSMIMPERYRAAHERGLERVARTGASTLAGQTLQMHGQKKDGSVFDLEMSIGTWQSTGRNFFSGVLRDVTVARAASEALRVERDFSSAVLDTTDALIIVIAADGRIMRFNGACETVSGFSAAEAVGRRFFDFLIPEDEAPAVNEAFKHLGSGARESRHQNHWLTKGGAKRLIAWSNRIMTDGEGRVTHVIGTGIDITDKQRAEAELERQHAVMTSVLETMTDGVVVTDENGALLLHNAAAQLMVGRGPNDGPPETWPREFGMFLEDGTTPLEPQNIPLRRALRGEHVEQFPILARTPLSPGGRWHSVTSTPIRNAAREFIGTVSVGRDISDRKRAQDLLALQAAELRELALTDELTGLHNRRGFLHLAEQQIRQVTRSKSQALLLFVDLDGMKRINDQFGHEEGDRALRNAADVLRAALRESDIIARLGGDEFVALASDVTEATMPVIVGRIRAAVVTANERAAKPYDLRMSVGASVFNPAIEHRLEVLIAAADARMYAQKQAQRMTAPVATTSSVAANPVVGGPVR